MLRDIETERVCLKCGEVNNINAENIKQKEVSSLDGEIINIMFYYCSRCNTINILQIDNDKTLKIKSRNQEYLLKLVHNKRKGIKLKKSQRRKLDVLDKQLKDEREKLSIIYNGLDLYDKDNKLFTKCLTNKLEGDTIEM